MVESFTRLDDVDVYRRGHFMFVVLCLFLTLFSYARRSTSDVVSESDK